MSHEMLVSTPTATPAPGLAPFADALLNPHAAVPDDVRGEHAAERQARLDIYRNNVTVSLAEALADSFDTVRQYVGDAFFRTAAVHYLRRHPPRSALLWRHGEGFPDFLAAYAPAAGLPVLPDLARLEWLRQAAYRASDVAVLPTDELARLLADPAGLPGLRLALMPSVQVLRSAHPVVSLWRAHQVPDATADGPAASGAGPEAALVHRDADDAVVIPVCHALARFVEALAAGDTLGDAVARASAPMPDGFALDLQAAWSLLIHHRALRRPQASNRSTP